MKRLPRKNIDTSQSVPDTPQKTPQTPKKKRLKKTKKDPSLTPTNADFSDTPRRLKSSIKGMKKPHKYLDFIVWMSRPPKSGEAINQEQFAQEIGVDETTLSRWKEKAGFWEDVDTLTIEWARGKTTVILNSILRTILKDARAPEARLWLQYTGQLKDQSKLNLGVDPEVQAALDKFARLLP